MEDCIFCKIAAGEMDTKLLHEDELVVAFADISPMAPVHALIVPKKHIVSVEEAGPEDRDLLGHMIHTAQKLARELGVSESGYRLVINNGAGAGQTVSHLHLHLLGGRALEPRLG
jgi:histidine triad (HIT) family protein